MGQLYRKRWTIEACFQNLKGRGFALRSTPLQGRDKLKKLVGLVVIVLVLVARWVSVGLPLVLLQRRYPFDRQTLRVLTWGGLRGGISVALALSLPESMPRDLIVGVTYVVVIFSIVVQGLSIGPLVRRLGLSTGEAPVDAGH